MTDETSRLMRSPANRARIEAALSEFTPDEIRAAEIEAAKMEGGIAGLELALILCKQVEGHYLPMDDDHCRGAVEAIHAAMDKMQAKLKEARP